MRHGLMARLAGRLSGWLCLSFGAALPAVPVIAAAPSAIAPPVAQESADCTRPVYATDQLVCGDPGLRRLDADMIARAIRVGQGAGWPVSPLFEDQQAWFRRRSRCAFQTDHRGCAAAAYVARIAELDAILDPPARQDPLRCAPGGPSRISSVTAAGARMMFDATGALAAIALPAKAGPWVSFLVYRGPDRHLILQRLDDPKRMTCHVAGKGG